MRPRRLPGLSQVHYVDAGRQELLAGKYGDLTANRKVTTRVKETAVLMEDLATSRLESLPPVPKAKDEFVPRRELEARLSQLDRRVEMLEDALRQQQQLTVWRRRTSSAITMGAGLWTPWCLSLQRPRSQKVREPGHGICARSRAHSLSTSKRKKR